MNYEEKLKSHIWFKELERQTRKQGGEEHLERRMMEQSRNIVTQAICWEMTNQGHTFWDRLHTDMSENILV